jgi:hypothetical protein
MRNLWLQALAALLGIWMVVGGVIWFVRSRKVTAESLASYVATHPVDGRSQDQREKRLLAVAEQLNQMEYEERQRVQGKKMLDPFYRSLSKEEQGRFLDLTMPAGFQQMMVAFNKMAPAKRKAMMEKSLEQMKNRTVEEAQPNTDDPHVRKMIEAGMQSFYSDASTETKLDLAPLIEQIQKNLQGVGP